MLWTRFNNLAILQLTRLCLRTAAEMVVPFALTRHPTNEPGLVTTSISLPKAGGSQVWGAGCRALPQSV